MAHLRLETYKYVVCHIWHPVVFQPESLPVSERLLSCVWQFYRVWGLDIFSMQYTCAHFVATVTCFSAVCSYRITRFLHKPGQNLWSADFSLWALTRAYHPSSSSSDRHANHNEPLLHLPCLLRGGHWIERVAYVFTRWTSLRQN